MKINIEFDLTPEEFRRAMGLPDVAALQEELLSRMRERIEAGLTEYDPVKLMEPFVTGNLKSVETFQRMFWDAMTQAKPKTDK